jgi:hypothetical protein
MKCLTGMEWDGTLVLTVGFQHSEGAVPGYLTQRLNRGNPTARAWVGARWGHGVGALK